MFEGHHSDIRIFISQVPFQVPSQGCLSQLSKVHTFYQVTFSYSFLCTLATMQSSCSSGPKGSPLFLVLGSCTILCWISPTLLTPLLTVPLINFPQLHHLDMPSLTYKDTDQVCRLFALLSSCHALPPQNRNQTSRLWKL